MWGRTLAVFLSACAGAYGTRLVQARGAAGAEPGRSVQEHDHLSLAGLEVVDDEGGVVFRLDGGTQLATFEHFGALARPRPGGALERERRRRSLTFHNDFSAPGLILRSHADSLTGELACFLMGDPDLPTLEFRGQPAPDIGELLLRVTVGNSPERHLGFWSPSRGGGEGPSPSADASLHWTDLHPTD